MPSRVLQFHYSASRGLVEPERRKSFHRFHRKGRTSHSRVRACVRMQDACAKPNRKVYPPTVIRPRPRPFPSWNRSSVSSIQRPGFSQLRDFRREIAPAVPPRAPQARWMNQYSVVSSTLHRERLTLIDNERLARPCHRFSRRCSPCDIRHVALRSARKVERELLVARRFDSVRRSVGDTARLIVASAICHRRESSDLSRLRRTARFVFAQRLMPATIAATGCCRRVIEDSILSHLDENDASPAASPETSRARALARFRVI